MPIKLRRLQFSLRALMLFVTAVALLLAWPASVMRRYEMTERVKEHVERLGGRVSFDYEFMEEWRELPDRAEREGLRVPWTRWLFGKRLTRKIVSIGVWTDSDASPADMEFLREAKDLRWLYWHPVTDDVFVAIPPLPELRHLDDSLGRISDRAAAHLASFPRLVTLNFSKTKITDSGLAALAGLAFLESLNVENTEVTGSGMPSGDRLPRLRELRAKGTRWTDAGAERLASIKSLESVELSGENLTHRAVGSLASLPKLRVFKIGGLDLAGPGVAHVARMARLETLDIRGGIGDDAAGLIANATNLSELNLEGSLVSDAGAARLASLKKLWLLNLARSKVSDRGMASLASLPKLFHLDLADTAVSDRGLREIAKVSGLVILDLSRTRVTMEGLRTSLPKMRSLQIVTLFGMPEVGARQVKELEILLPPGCRVTADTPDTAGPLGKSLHD